MTEAQYQELCRRVGAIAEPAERRVPIPKPIAPPDIVSGPLSVLLKLYGHCPSKKSDYRIAGNTLILTDEAKAQIKVLQIQATFQWAQGIRPRYGPVEHPQVSTTFFVRSARQDEDGMYVTLMDVLQKAGVIVNDNIVRFNGRKIHEPCEVVSEADERVEILVEKL